MSSATSTSTAPDRRRIHGLHTWWAAALLGCWLVTGVSAQTDRTWSINANGNWNTDANWGGNRPNSATERAVLNQATGYTITFNATNTVGGILFNGTGGYTISRTGGGTTLTLDQYGVNTTSSANQIITGPNLRLTLGNNTFFGVNGSGNLTISTAGGTIATTATRNLTLNGTGTGTGLVSSVISGAGNIVASGTTNWTLSGTNTFTGTTTVSAGNLAISSEANLGANPGAFNAAQLTLNGGTLNTTATFAIDDTNRGVTLGASGGTISPDVGTTLTIANPIAGAGALTKAGLGDIVLTGANTYGATTISAGNLQIGAGGTTGTLGTGTVANSGTLTFNRSNSYTASNVISGTGTVTQAGSGTTTLSGTNTYTGITTVSAGTLAISSEANLGANPGALNAAQLTLNGGTLNTTATFAIDDTNRGVTIGASGGTFNTNASTTLTVASIIAGSGGLVKMGTGTLINSGAGFNSHTGPITVSEGILRFAKTAAVGAIDNIAAVSVASGASLQFDNASLYTIETMGNISGAGTIESIGAAPINLKVNNDNLSSTFSGQINSTNNGGLELWKMGTGNLILSNTTSNYSGQTEIQAGTLTISSIGNLGVASSVGAPTSVANGTIAMGLTSAATLAYTGTGHSTNRVIDLAGTTSGATLDASGSGALVFTSAFTATGAGSKTLTLTGTSTAANTIQGAIVNNSGANTTSLVKNGAGTWTLSGTNSYTGTTTINAGTLAISSEANLGANPGAFNAAQLTLNGGTLNTTATFAIDDSNRGITIGASGGTINTDPSTTLTVANPMAGSGNLTKSGTGNIVLSASSTSFTGAVTIDAGTATLSHSNAIGGGTANTTVTNGAALTLQGGIGISKGTLYLSGTGVSNSGALVSATGNNSWNGNITLNGNTTIKTNSAGVDYLDLGTFQPLLTRPPVDATTTSLGSHTLTLAGGTGTSEIYLNGRITGTGGLTVNMTNTGDKVFLSSHLNTFTGTTEIKNGTLVPATLPNTYPFDNSGGGGTDQYYGLNGPITIGDGTGAANSAVLSIRNSGTRYQELINHTVPITLYKDGLFEVGSAQSIGSTDGGINPLGQSLIFNGGNVSIGTNGLLYLAGDVKVNATAGQTAVIDGVGNTLSLTIQKGVLNNPPNADRVFDVVGGVGNTSDLTINATIKNGSITKNGAGTMTITGNNAAGYEGTTTINNGIVAITNNGSLGQGLTNNASATVVNSGGTLQLSNSITVSNEWLRLNGNGFNSNGALLNLSGTNTWAGSVFLDSDARVQSDAGLLTLSGTTTSSTNANLDVRGSGNTTISGAIGTGSGGVTKNGTGTLTLSGVNTYSGATTVNQGVLSLQSSSGLGAAGTGTTVGNSAELQLDNTAIGGGSNVLTTLAEPLTITGSGVTGQGALRSVSGPNVFAGQVTINTGGATVTANNAHSLTLSGGTTSSNQNLTVGTGAENGNVTISGNMTNGTGSLIKAGTGSLTIASGSTQSATVGQVQLNAGTITVGGGGGNSTLNATDFDSAGSTTLTIASGGLVNVTQAAGTTSTFAGAMAGSGEFKFNGTANFGTPASSSILALSSPFTASSLTLTLNGGLLSLSGVGQYEFGTIHITGNTILDFNNSAGTWLRSAALVIDGGVTITVRNWTATAGLPGSSTVWYATSTINAGSLGAPPTNQVGGTPLNQITFAGWNATDYPTTWVNTAQNGWFDREIRPTPEPSTYGALLLSGCLGLLGWRRLRARKKTAA